jgi:hypothetical protein
LIRLELSVWLKGRAFELREDHAIFGLVVLVLRPARLTKETRNL